MAGVKGLEPSLSARQADTFPDGYTPAWGDRRDLNPQVPNGTPGPQPGAVTSFATNTIMAGVGGIEPPTPWLTATCSAAELYPSNLWRRQGSNLRHPACKAGALPTELLPHIYIVGREGFEPSTNGLKVHYATRLRHRPLVGPVGLEPTACRLRVGYSTIELRTITIMFLMF